MTQAMNWDFPLPRTHTGVPLGNGRMGLLLWGGDRTLRITIGRADLWDHRGGMPWTARQNYQDIRSALEKRDETRVRELFRPETKDTPGQPAKPSVLPIGRLELQLSPGCELTNAVLELQDGIVRVFYVRGGADGEKRSLAVGLHPGRDIAWVLDSEDVNEIHQVTSWDIMGERLASLSFQPPQDVPGASGWLWPLPSDPGVFVSWKRVGAKADLLITTGRADTIDDVQKQTVGTAELDPARLGDESRSWWHGYWERVSRLEVPNELIQEIHDYGLYLFAGLTNPTGVPATLQGPWIEEYDFPPWSSDYHFNINVQMCYSPALRSGLFDHLRPLFDMIWSWRDRLRENARNFIGVDGYMLPHAVDDRCTCMGTFWTGTIDHACTAWVSQMMFDYADYSGDEAFLRDTAFPFMKGVFEVYRAMLEDHGDQLRLPVSVSPEYRGANMDAWGANASFQLAAIHRLCENLSSAAEVLKENANPSWNDVSRRLPRATLTPDGERIALWEGVDLEESHRHHSHLAGVAPFDTLDPFGDDWREVIESTLRHWIGAGMGLWSGWCMSWASQLHSRVHNGAGAQMLLELWRKVFTNEGRGSMHDAVVNGLTLMGAPELIRESTRSQVDSGRGSTGAAILAKAERMQLDGAMGSVAAVQEMLLYAQRGTIHLFPAIPASWSRVSFERMRAPGGLTVSGWYENPTAWRVRIEATRQTRARLRLPDGLREIHLHAQEECRLQPRG